MRTLRDYGAELPDIREFAQRLLDLCHPVPFCGCYLWAGADSGNGYGKVHRNGRGYYVHRVVYEGLVDRVPAGMILDHAVCGVRHCANPRHLEPVTVLENTMRGGAVLYSRSVA